MLNIIKTDIYRVFRSTGIYITVTLFIFLVVLQIASGNVGTIGINTVAYGLQPSESILTGMNAPIFAIKTTDTLLYFTLPLIIFVSVADFYTGTVKNVLYLYFSPEFSIR